MQQAVKDFPDAWQVWFDLGLVHKLRREWAPSVAANRRAAALGQAEECYYNMGVAATAIRDWDAAMEAWQGIGVDVGPGPEPRGDFGPCPVRLNPETDGEVVWGRRIDPCRMRLESVPLPESGHRWGDVVLHDVVPVGRRMLKDRALPVFEELIRMEPSDAPTFESEVIATEEDRDALAQAVTNADLGFEDWSESIQMLCDACSRGDLQHDHHARAEPSIWTLERRLGLAGPEEAVRATLSAWAQAAPGRAVVRFEQVA